MKNSFDDMTQEDFDKHLQNVTYRTNLLDVPGVLEIVQEYFHNDVLDSWAEANNRCSEHGCVLDDNGNCGKCESEVQRAREG